MLNNVFNNQVLAANLTQLRELRAVSETRHDGLARVRTPIRILIFFFFIISEVDVYFVNKFKSFKTSKLKYEKVVNSVVMVISPELAWGKITRTARTLAGTRMHADIHS